MQQPFLSRLFLRNAFLLLPAVWLAFGCRPTVDPDKQKKYTGPVMETRDVQTLYSDSAQLKIKLNAGLQQQYENGDAIYPKGLNLTFLDENGRVSSTLRANYGKYDKNTDAYMARGNVIVTNTERKQTLNTEELHWAKQKRRIHTDKFVKIRTEDEVLTGTGLEANQDFSRYKILKPAGVFSVKE
jgi:LPS export ABC transporter protein LptC